MRAPQVVRLAEIDERRFITACRHGLVHLTWNRVTVRLGRDEFRRLEQLLAHAAGPMGPVRDGEMQVTCSRQECEVQIGSFSLTFSLGEFQVFTKAVQEAVGQLDKVLDSGMWDEKEREDAPPGILEQFGRHLFSEN